MAVATLALALASVLLSLWLPSGVSAQGAALYFREPSLLPPSRGHHGASLPLGLSLRQSRISLQSQLLFEQSQLQSALAISACLAARTSTLLQATQAVATARNCLFAGFRAGSLRLISTLCAARPSRRTVFLAVTRACANSKSPACIARRRAAAAAFENSLFACRALAAALAARPACPSYPDALAAFRAAAAVDCRTGRETRSPAQIRARIAELQAQLDALPVPSITPLPVEGGDVFVLPGARRR